jgi:hypothetical protein
VFKGGLNEFDWCLFLTKILLAALNNNSPIIYLDKILGALNILICTDRHWWKKGLPFDTYVSNQIRSATNGLISPGSFENMGQGALVPVQKGPSVPVSSNSRD